MYINDMSLSNIYWLMQIMGDKKKYMYIQMERIQNGSINIFQGFIKTIRAQCI